MRTYQIGFNRLAEPGESQDPCFDVRESAPTVYDETEFDVTGDDPAELLALFGDFVAENDFQIEGGFRITEVPYDGFEEE